MRLLRPFRPRLIGSVMTGHVRKGSDIDIHVFCRQCRPRHRPARAGGLPVRRRTQAGRQARRGARLHAHPRLRPLQLRADRLRRGQGPLRLQKLDHRQADRAGLDPRAGGAAAARVPGHRSGRGAGATASGGRSVPDLPHAAAAAGGRPAVGRGIIPRATCCIIRSRSSSWRASTGLTTRSSCWRLCCTTSARGWIRPIT